MLDLSWALVVTSNNKQTQAEVCDAIVILTEKRKDPRLAPW